MTGGQLGGNGKILGPVKVQSGGTFVPGNSLGTLIINNSLTFSNGSTTVLEISKTGAATTNDAVAGLTSVAFGGTLNVANVGPDALAKTLEAASGTFFSMGFLALFRPTGLRTCALVSNTARGSALAAFTPWTRFSRALLPPSSITCRAPGSISLSFRTGP